MSERDAGDASNDHESAASMSEAEAKALAKKKLENKKKREKAKQKKKAQATGESKTQQSAEFLAEFAKLGLHEVFQGSTKMQWDPVKGRHVVATGPIPAGELVFESPAYAAVLLDFYYDKMCHRCLKPAKVLFKCKECEYAHFCTQECMNAQSVVHLLECKTLRSLSSLELGGESAPLRLIVRMIHQHAQENKYRQRNEEMKASKKIVRGVKMWTPRPGLTFEDAAALEAHLDDFSQETKLQLMLILNQVEKLVDPENWPGVDVCMKLFFQIQVNAHHIVTDNREKIGLGLYPAASSLNHSCRPNCVYHFTENGTIHVRSVADINVGDEITYSYIDLYQPKAERAKVLQEIYHVKACYCARCHEDLFTSPDRFLEGVLCQGCKKDIVKPNTVGATGKCQNAECKGETDMMDAASAGKDARTVLDKAIHLVHTEDFKAAHKLVSEKILEAAPAQLLHPRHVTLFNTYLVMVGAAQCLQNWEEEAVHAQQIVECLQPLNLANHPETADAYFRLGEALNNIADGLKKAEEKERRSELKAKALDAFMNAWKIRQAARGKQHARTKEARHMVTELSAAAPANAPEPASKNKKKS